MTPEDINSQAWADKYNNIVYEMVDKKIKIKIPDYVYQYLPRCEYCDDTGWLFNDFSYKKYPCSCEKGTEKSKKTDYMGPKENLQNKTDQIAIQSQINSYQEEQLQIIKNIYGNEIAQQLVQELTGNINININKLPVDPIQKPILPLVEGRKFRR